MTIRRCKNKKESEQVSGSAAKKQAAASGGTTEVGNDGEGVRADRRRVAVIKKIAQRLKSKNNGRGEGGTLETRPVAAKEPMPQTPLTPEELEVFRRVLLNTRARLSGDVDHMEEEALKQSRSDASGDLSLMPIHMADIGTDNYEREFTIGLIENKTETLKEIDAALERIEDRTYGICEATRKPIRKARLKAKPWARFCIDFKRSQEEKQDQRR